MLAMSLTSWAHSPSPSQTHLDPLGHREVKFPSVVHPKLLPERTPTADIFCCRQKGSVNMQFIKKHKYPHVELSVHQQPTDSDGASETDKYNVS